MSGSTFRATLAVAVLSTFLLVPAFVLAPATARAADDPGRPKSLELTDLAGTAVSLADLRGRLVVLNFWATWCQPCVQELPVLVDLAARYRDREVTVVAASVDDAEDLESVTALASTLGEDVQVWVGAGVVDMTRMGLGAALPATAVLDREGRIVFAKRGAISKGTLDPVLDEALDGAPAKEPKPALPGLESASAAPEAADAGRRSSMIASASAPVVAEEPVEEHVCEEGDGHGSASADPAAVVSRVPS